MSNARIIVAPATVIAAGLALAACAGGPFAPDEPSDQAAVGPPVSVTLAPGEDVTRPAPRATAADDTAAASGTVAQSENGTPPAAVAGARLGETLAGLGAPSEDGLWLRTGLVQSVQTGRVTSESGETLVLELRPSGREPGAGSHLSLAAMQALDLPLTRLAALQVFAGQ